MPWMTIKTLVMGEVEWGKGNKHSRQKEQPFQRL